MAGLWIEPSRDIHCDYNFDGETGEIVRFVDPEFKILQQQIAMWLGGRLVHQPARPLLRTRRSSRDLRVETRPKQACFRNRIGKETQSQIGCPGSQTWSPAPSRGVSATPDTPLLAMVSGADIPAGQINGGYTESCSRKRTVCCRPIASLHVLSDLMAGFRKRIYS